MKFRFGLTALACLLSVSTAFAGKAQSTNLKVSISATNDQVKIAISKLNLAVNNKNEKSRDMQIASAKKLLDSSEKTLRFSAAVYCDGQQQFLNENQDPCYVSEESTCFTGNSSDAAQLINTAAKNGFWQWDEYLFRKASSTGNKVNVTIHDGPNDTTSESLIEQCK